MYIKCQSETKMSHFCSEILVYKTNLLLISEREMKL